VNRLPLRHFRQPETSPVAAVYDLSRSSELVEQCEGRLEIGCLKALIEPVMD
jgi:hypothetical protein